jgi:hypothetical protein
MHNLVAIMHRKLNPEEYILNENIHPYNTRNKTKVAVESHSSNSIKIKMQQANKMVIL